MELARREARVEDSQWGSKFKGEEKTRTPPGGPPGQERRKRDGTMGLEWEFEKDGTNPRTEKFDRKEFREREEVMEKKNN